ncbi:hypothetical protein Poli38472_014618 [Pythium oligandrum]|uniref:Uncharacterized protein n=1 Tax=Pythium oligandrum TaxID=41045 RepID=A0A8K1CQ72_PYTOL|nr:hypothetical protein Poli38472_014618 [Pythium oligandrum]|eukprot:TMW66642.1 hypothetical protein Poli38472_014618 [Pythium oligandrum]
MRKLKTVKRSAILKASGCTLKPTPLHELRWSGCYRMLKCIEDILPHLHHFYSDLQVDRDDLTEDSPPDDIRRLPFADLIPTAIEQRTITGILEEMDVYDVITCKLQSQDVTIADVRDMFDVVVEEHEMKDYVAPFADIVESPHF